MTRCPNCGNELISEIKGSTLIVRCTKCEYSVTTTHIDPIYEDDNEYEVFLEKGNEITKENYFLIQSLTNMTMLEIKHLLETTPCLLFKGLAPEVKELKEKLDECGINYSIVPEFRYQSGHVSPSSISKHREYFYNKSAESIASDLKDIGYDTSIRRSTHSTSKAKSIVVANSDKHRNITQILVSPGSKRHGDVPYVKISTSDWGKIKVVNSTKSEYITDGKETAKLFFRRKK